MKTKYNEIKVSIYKYRKTKKGLLALIYNNQKGNSIRRGHNPPEYSLSELRKYILSDKKFNELYDNWVQEGFDIHKTPSLDRINPLLGYSLKNIQIMTYGDNLKKGHKERNLTQGKRVAKYKDGIKIKEYLSITDAGKENNIGFQQISLVCNNYYGRKTAGGYSWKFLQPST